MASGRVTIKTSVDDKSLKDLRSTLKDLESAFKSLQSIDPFSGISQEARKLINEFTGLSSSAEQVDRDINKIDGKSMEDVSKKASDAGSSLENTAQSADKADISIGDIDGRSMDSVTKKAGDASNELKDTATSAERADASLDDVDSQSLGKVADEADKAGKEIGKAEGKTNRFSISLKDIAKSAIVINAVSKAFDILAASLGDAITRYDTLNTFPRTMELIGYETAVVDRTTRALVRGIEGLPTKLDDVIQTAQRLGGMTGDLDDATETTLALNNAFLASGASAADASRGTEQYIQMLGNGKPDMQSWTTLTETMNYALLEAAKSFGYTENGVQQLYNALKGGDITFKQFNKRLQELNNAQDGFADLALENSKTLEAAWTNVQTSISRNLANVIEAVDEMVMAVTGKDIYDNLTNLKYVIDDVFGVARSAISGVTPIISLVADAFGILVGTLKVLEPVIWGVVTGLTAIKVVQGVNIWLGNFGVVIAGVTKAMQIFTATQGAMKVSIQGVGIGTKALATIIAAATGKISIATVAMTALKTAFTTLIGPVGWVIGAIGLVAGAAGFLYSAFVKASDETQELGAALKETADETAELNDLVDQTASMYEKTKRSTKGQYDAIRQLADETSQLAQQEKLSAGEKKILKDNIDELNDSVDGLNLVYDEEQQRLVASNDAMLERIRMAEEDAKYNDARERSAQIIEQHDEATARLIQNEKELAEAQEHLDSLPWIQSSGEAKEGVEQLREENERLVAQIQELSEEKQIADIEMTESAQASAEAEEAANQKRITSLEGLPPAQSKAIQAMQDRYSDLEKTTTEMFDKIEGKSRISIEEMNENLKHNQEMVENWSKNLATLSEQGVDQGMLDQLARLGPEGAPYVQELVDATPDQLAELEENFVKGGEVAKQGLFDSMGIEESDAIDGVPEFATRTELGLRQAFEGSGLRKTIPDELSKGQEDMIQAGGFIAEGATKGLAQGTPKVRKASENMAKEVNTGFANELQIQSPSQVFKRHGDDIGEGLTLGIKSSGTRTITAIRILGNELNRLMRTDITTMNRDVQTGYTAIVNTIRNNMNQVPPLIKNTMSRSTQFMRQEVKQSQLAGVQLGLGFYNGLNSTSGAIYSLATTIARNAVNRINSALKVQSPSKEGYASGDYLGQGLWLGMKHQVGNVEKWADKLGQSALIGMLKPAPLGFNSQLITGANSGGTNSESYVQHDNRNFTLNANASGTESNDREFYERLFREFKWYIEQEGGAFGG